MTAEVAFSLAPIQDLFRTTAADRDAMAKFQSSLDTCLYSWHRGDTMVLLQGNLQELFGDMLMQYFENSLVKEVGQPVTFAFSNSSNGGQTVVQIPESKKGHIHLQAATESQAQEHQVVSPPRNESTVVKKARRPMNCWIIFRDDMHKKLKAENPHLTVQQISTMCSQMWHDLSPVDKKYWQAAAKSAKEEHLRANPDYKYSPRKPGEKKKRQSRKAKQAPTFAADPSLFDISSVPEPTTLAHTDDQPMSLASLSQTAIYDTPIDFGTMLAADVAQLMTPPSQSNAQADNLIPAQYLHDAESIRHSRLEAELGADLEGIMPFDLFGEEAFAFRAGGDGDATLPSFYSDLY